MLNFHIIHEVQFVPGPNPIPALACPGTPGLEFPSTHSYGYGFTPGVLPFAPYGASGAVPNRSRRFGQSNPASSRTCPAPSSGMLVQYSG